MEKAEDEALVVGRSGLNWMFVDPRCQRVWHKVATNSNRARRRSCAPMGRGH